MRFLNYANLWGSFENQTIFNDVISGRKCGWIKKFEVIQDSGLNFHIKQSDLPYLFLEGPWSMELLDWGHVFNFEVEKNRPKPTQIGHPKAVLY